MVIWGPAIQVHHGSPVIETCVGRDRERMRKACSRAPLQPRRQACPGRSAVQGFDSSRPLETARRALCRPSRPAPSVLAKPRSHMCTDANLAFSRLLLPQYTRFYYSLAVDSALGELCASDLLTAQSDCWGVIGRAGQRGESLSRRREERHGGSRPNDEQTDSLLLQA